MEYVVVSVAAHFGYAHVLHFLLGVALGREIIYHIVVAHRVAEAEPSDDVVGQSAPGYVFPCLCRDRQRQIVVIAAGGVAHQVVVTRALLLIEPGSAAAGELRHLHVRFVCKHLYGVQLVHVFHLGDEGYGVAALAAAEAVVQLFDGIDGERRRLFIMKRTTRLVAVAHAPQRRITRY